MKIIGHRGARGLAAENTLESINRAIAAGVEEVEIDLRVTSDGTVVLIHDKDLKRLANSDLVVAESTYKELIQVKPDLCTLDEALDLINRQLPVMVEVKPHVKIEPIVAIIKQRLQSGWKTTDFLIGSFNQKTLISLHKDLPDIETIVITHWSGVHASWRARQLKSKRINMSRWALWNGYIYAAAKSGYKLCVYSLNDVKRAKQWEKYGLYGVITDYPDRFKEVK